MIEKGLPRLPPPPLDWLLVDFRGLDWLIISIFQISWGDFAGNGAGCPRLVGPVGPVGRESGKKRRKFDEKLGELGPLAVIASALT